MAQQTLIDSLSSQVQTIEKTSNTAWWNLAITGEDKYAKALEEGNVALRKLFSSPEKMRTLASTNVSDNPLLNRQKALLLNQFRENQIPAEMIERMTALETEIESIYTNFRPTVKGKQLSNNDLKKILVESNDSEERKEAWEASKKIGQEVEAKLKQLLAMRNTAAQKAGFKNYYSMRLELQEINEEKLFKLLAELHSLTNPAWKKYKDNLHKSLSKRFGLSAKEIFPWHYQDPFFQEAPSSQVNLDAFYQGKNLVDISREFYGKISMPVDDVIDRSDLFEREKKNQHAFCTCIDRSQDVRILCNLRENEYWMGTQLHELGHAVYDKFIDQKLPFLLRTPAHTSTTEAIAMLFGRLSKNRDFLKHYVGVNGDNIEKIAESAKKQSAENLLVFARWTLVMIHFEQAMYQKDGVDLNALWWDLVEKYQGVQRVSGRDKPDWASKLHLACAPVYYQNYLLGEMTASQLLHDIKEQLDAQKEEFCTSPLVGEYLRQRLFALGALFPWDETLRQVTGEGLNPAYFSRDAIVD